MPLLSRLCLLLLLWLSLASFATQNRPALIVPPQACHYEADVTLGDDAQHLRGAAIGHITVTACSSPQDLANQVAAGEAAIRRAWATSRAQR
jgi:hypothetical protein